MFVTPLPFKANLFLLLKNIIKISSYTYLGDFMDENIVNTNQLYDSTLLAQDIYYLNIKYPFLNVQTIGNSVLGKPISCIRLGRGSKTVFYSGSIHANEWITSLVLMKFVEDYCKAYVNNSKIFGYDAKYLFQNVSIFIAPMVNPDGVDLVNGTIQTTSSAFIQARRIANNYPEIVFPEDWKANINGVDLNLQFPANWERAKEIKYSQGFTSPAPRDFVGFSPLTEPEAIALYNFTLRHNFNLILAYHSQGKVIYWKYDGFNPANAESIGKKFSEISGYTLESTPAESAYAGYKDWFIQTYNKPGYTIEVGEGTSPLPLSQFNEIYNDNIGILVLGGIL